MFKIRSKDWTIVSLFCQQLYRLSHLDCYQIKKTSKPTANLFVRSFLPHIILIQSHIISSKITKLERYFISLEVSFQFHCHFCSVCIHICMLFTLAINIVKSTHERSKWNIIQNVIIDQYKWHSKCNYSQISDFWYTNRVNEIKVTRHD